MIIRRVEMSKQEKLRERIKAKPTDFTWSELKSLLAGFGFEPGTSGKTGGSRIRFLHPKYPPIMMHKPHPAKVLKRYQVEQVLEFLRKEGLL
jgi:hypothetical protein